MRRESDSGEHSDQHQPWRMSVNILSPSSRAPIAVRRVCVSLPPLELFC